MSIHTPTFTVGHDQEVAVPTIMSPYQSPPNTDVSIMKPSHEYSSPASSIQTLETVTGKVKKVTSCFWPIVGSATTLLILLGLILVVLPLYSSQSQLKAAINIVNNIETIAVPVEVMTTQGKLDGLIDLIQSKISHLNVDPSINYISTTDTFVVSLTTTTSFSVSNRVSLRSVTFKLSANGEVLTAIKELSDFHVNNLQFQIDPFNVATMTHTLEEYFASALGIVTLQNSRSDIAVVVQHIRNHVDFRVTLSLELASHSLNFAAEFLYSNQVAVQEGMEVLRNSIVSPIELESASSDYIALLQAHISFILTLNNFHDFTIEVTKLSGNSYRITLTRGTASLAETFALEVVVVNMQEVQESLTIARTNIVNAGSQLKCFATESAYTSAHDRRTTMLGKLKSIVNDDRIDIVLETAGWKVKLNRASLVEELSIYPSFRDVQLIEPQQVDAGFEFSAILSKDGMLFMFGTNSYGEVGHTGTSSIPHMVLSNVKSIACGSHHTVALTNEGHVWTVGRNHFGQLGHGNTLNLHSFKRIVHNLNNDVIGQVVAGFHSTVLIATNGLSYHWFGQNNKNKFGTGSSFSSTPTRVARNNAVFYVKISIGSDHILDVLSNGEARGRGGNGHGQIGDGSNTDRSGYEYVRRYGSLYNFAVTDMIDVHAGHFFSFGLQQSSGSFKVWSWGSNYNGELMAGSTTTKFALATERFTLSARPKTILTLADNTLMLNVDIVQGSGLTSDGLLGTFTGTQRSRVTVASGFSTIGCSSNAIHCVGVQNKTPVAWGTRNLGSFGNGHTFRQKEVVPQQVGCVEF
ncbi:hypothetical protein RCL1_006276 [Eukaryota sp. TZLM3-RCL]